VQPLAGAAIFTVVFGNLADLPSDGIPYLLFAFAGFSLWSYFSVALNVARGSLISNESLITKVYFPRLVAPLAAILPGLIDLGVAMVVLVIMMVGYGTFAGVEVLAAPLFLLWTMVVAFGTGTLLAAVTVQYRDVQQVFGFVTQLWLYATPVAYASTLVEGPWRWIYAVNPMVGALDGWRWSLLGGPAPGPEALVSAASGLALLVAGLVVFQRAERRFADII
jgi:lipopolysaccharide transport system permease protein